MAPVAATVLATVFVLNIICEQSNGDFIKGSERLTWTDANKWCADNGRHLASIHSVEENTKADEVCLGEPQTGYTQCWIGADKSSGAWRWTDNSPWDYDNWGGSEPINNRECAYLMYTKWFSWWPDYQSVLRHPICGEDCSSSAVVSNFYWKSLNGEYKKVEGILKNGKSVYKHATSTRYIWFNNKVYYDSPWWVMGQNYEVDSWYAYRYGSNLFEPCNSAWNGWCAPWWFAYHWNSWLDHTDCCGPIEISLGCPARLNVAADTGIEWDDAIPNGTNYIPPVPEAVRSSAVFPYLEITVGVAIGAAVIVVLIIAIILKKKKMNKSDDAKRDGAHHVAELSPSEIMADGVKVVTTEEVTKKESVAVTEVAAVSVEEFAAQIPEDGAVNAE